MASPFSIVVLGDSIQWGQGLRPGTAAAPSDKMAELVGVALATSPAVISGWSGGAGIAVTVSRFASSGATINGLLPPAGTPPGVTPVTATTAFPAGEVPGSLPTVLDQVAGASGVIDVSAVNLVIIDGGINDVGLFPFILNPLVGAGTIAVRANAACGGSLSGAASAALLPAGSTAGAMSAVLTACLTTFKNAVFVVTGYYTILSPLSDLLGLIITVGLITGAVVPELLLPGGWLISTLAGLTAATTAAAAVLINCATFASTTNTALTSAVALANAAPGGTFSALGVTVPRFTFVPSPLTPLNSLFTFGLNGADESGPTSPALLWGFNPSIEFISDIIDASTVTGSVLGGIFGFLGGPIGSAVGSSLGAAAGAAAAVAAIIPVMSAVDEVAGARTGPGGACAGIPPGPLGVGVLPCNLASVGHPNIEGEAAYAAAISPLMITMFGTSLPSVGIAGVVQAASGCIIATAALEPTAADQVTRIRRVRDAFVAQSALGKDFFAAAEAEYYAFSPIIAARMRSSPAFRERVRRFAVSPLLSFADLLDNASLDVLARALDASLADVDSSDASELVEYFNSASAGGYVDVLLLEPLRLYWDLLRERAAAAPLASIQARFDAGLNEWFGHVGALASRFGTVDVAAEIRMLARLYGDRL